MPGTQTNSCARRAAARRRRGWDLCAAADLPRLPAPSPAREQQEEDEKRRRAIRWMEAMYVDRPNGAPVWYRRDGSSGLSGRRPMAWVKDLKTGRVRRRIALDDFDMRMREIEEREREREERESEEGESD